ncbi:MFS transporter [Saccharopolyspora flava]|uniref:Major Facilitator Superfamily protein n=1 Tax=Saccharopolyspora flava TaxID=95161 RepID=A0A1I6TLH3_9PSEU|nr:Major Facilitator Superfamily protein [Saccharopolyspora flava]
MLPGRTTGPVGLAQPRGAAVPTLVIIALVAFVTTLDNNIVAAAVPSIGRELALGLTELQWISLGYILPFAGLLLVAGNLVDRWGQRRTLLLGLLVFGTAALAGGFARDAVTLIAARVVQGCAAAVLVPATLSLLRTNLDVRGRAIGAGIWTAALAVAIAVGPATGGLLSEHLHWSWIFFSNVPFAIAAAALTPAAAVVTGRSAPGRVDVRGMLLVTAAMLLFLMALVGTGEDTPGPAGRFVLAGLGAVSLAGFALVQRRSPNPLLPRALVAERAFLGGVSVQLLWGLGVSGVFFFTPLLHQESLALTPTEAGLPLVLVAVAIVGATPLVAPAVERWGPRYTVLAGLILVSAGLVAIAVINHIPAVPPRIPGLLLIGAGSALTTPLTSFSLEVVAARDAGIASGVLTASRELSSALGVALIGLVLTVRQNAELAGGTPAPHALASGFTAGLITAAIVELLAAVVTFVCFRSRTAELVAD